MSNENQNKKSISRPQKQQDSSTKGGMGRYSEGGVIRKREQSIMSRPPKRGDSKKNK